MPAKIIFLLCVLFAASPLVWAGSWASPPVALALGVVFGLAFVHPFAGPARNTSKRLLQLSVVGLGFGMNLQQVLKAGRSGFIYTLLGISFALAAGWTLGKLFKVCEKSSYLISVGTAICGGSAIAAVAPVIDASDEELSVAIGTVFILNAVGLLIFPPLGHQMHLSESQFGLWAALAIHDTSSVVGAGAKFGAIALAIATTVKLARALWIVPVTLGTAALQNKKVKNIQWPWFILFFLLAAIMNTYLAPGNFAYTWAARLARIGLTITLFLIGTGISRSSIKQVGVRPLAQGIALWFLVAIASLILIRTGLIAI
ncbi:MAG: hypothetical protein JWO20_1989 [Candidatus Angelobacter sp.]|jgi:uncharacterized integral membrane protein (TIGR00698 family)|nr:hypothetical protein [Candidatus Angelobacter sp.]